VVQSEVLFVVIRHEGVIKAEHSVGIGLCNHLRDEGMLVVVEMHIANEEEITFKFMVLLALEE
jgi:hypothetical protein